MHGGELFSSGQIEVGLQIVEHGIDQSSVSNGHDLVDSTGLG